MVFQRLWIARCSFKIMVPLIIYTLRVKEGFVLTGYRNNWMSQKNNWQCHQRNLDISNRKLIIKLNHRVICVTQIHVSKKISLASSCITGLWLHSGSWRLLKLAFVSSACGSDALEWDLRCGSIRSVLKYDRMCCELGFQCVSSLSVWYCVYRFLNGWISWKSVRELPQVPLVFEKAFLKIRHLLLSLHFARGFPYCLQKE